MDPLTTATTFATIVSLMADFVTHRGAGEAKDFDTFMEWLAEQRHEEVRSLLMSNTATVVSIKALLNESRSAILERLNGLDRALASIASGIGEFREIATLANPSGVLSDQAISVLEQFNDAEASKLLASGSLSGVRLLFLDGTGGMLKYNEPRFIEDDLETLLGAGLLNLGHNNKGERIFKFTRAAAAIVEQRRKA